MGKLVTSWKTDNASKDPSAALFVEEEMIQCHDDDVERCYDDNALIFDKVTFDEMEGASEEDEAITLMVLWSLLLILHLSKKARKI